MSIYSLAGGCPDCLSNECSGCRDEDWIASPEDEARAILRAGRAYAHALDPYGLMLDKLIEAQELGRRVYRGKEVPKVHILLGEIDAATYEMECLPPGHPERKWYQDRLEVLTRELIQDRRRAVA